MPNLKIFATVVIAGALILPPGVRAEGGVHTQSAFMCGAPFDLYMKDPTDPKKVKITNYCAGSSIANYPLQSGDKVTMTVTYEGSRQTISMTQCKTLPSDPGKPEKLVQECVPSVPVCGALKRPNQPDEFYHVYILPFAIDHYIEPKIKFKKNWVIGACAAPWVDPDYRELNGAVAKCAAKDWFDYPPTRDGAGKVDVKLFRACILMARDDQSGNGDSDTDQGIWVHVGTQGTQSETLDCSKPEGACFEATWDDKGITCLAHARERAKAAIKGLAKKVETLKSIEVQQSALLALERPVSDDQFVIDLTARHDEIREMLAQSRGRLTRLVKAIATAKAQKAGVACDPDATGLIWNRSKKREDPTVCAKTDYDFPMCDYKKSAGGGAPK